MAGQKKDKQKAASTPMPAPQVQAPPGQAPQTPTAQAPPRQVPQAPTAQAPPETILQLLRMMVVGFVKSIPKAGIWMLAKSLLIFLFIMYVNYYVIAVKNEGFGGNPEPGTFWYYLFNLGANKAAFNVLVVVASFLLTSIISQIRARGFKKFFGDLFHVFHWSGYCAVKAGRWSLPTLLFSAGVMSLAGLVANNRVLFVTLAIGQFFAFIAQNRNMTYTAARVCWNDFQRAFRGKKPRTPVNEGVAGFLPLGFLLGAVFLFLVPFQFVRVGSILLCILFVGLGVFLASGKATPKAVATILVFVGVNLLWMRLFGRAFADDGGRNEVGGSFANYVRDPGGQQVIKNGVQPGLLGTLGGLLGSMVSGAANAASGAYNAAANAASGLYNTAANAASGLYNTAANAASSAYNAASDAYDAAANTASDAYDAAANAASDAYDAAAGLASDAAEVLGDAYDAAAGAVGTVIDEAGYVAGVAIDTVAGTVGQIVDTGLYVVGGILTEGGELIYDGAVAIHDLATDDQLWNDWWENMYNDLSQMGDTASNAVGGLVQDIRDYNASQQFRDDFWEGVYNTLSGGWDAAGGLADSAWNCPDKWGAVSNALGNAWDGFSNIVNDPEKVYDTIKSLTGVRSIANSWDPNRGGWERVGYAALGSFEAYGTITTFQSVGSTIYNRFDDFMAGYSDDAARALAARNAQGLSDDMARNLGQRGDFIHTNYVDDPNFMTRDSIDKMRQLARNGGEPIYVRLGNADSVHWIESGQAVPKDLWLKNKTINSLDEMLGARPGSRGLVGYFEPKLPDNYASLPQKLQRELASRFEQRMGEISHYGGDLNRMIRNGDLAVDQGVLIQRGRNGAKDMFIAGDNDLFHTSQAIENAAINTEGSGVLHGSLSRYPQYTGPHGFDEEAFIKMRNAATTRGTTGWNTTFNPEGGVVSFNPDGTITRAYVTNPTFRIPPRTTMPGIYVTTEAAGAAMGK